MPSPPAPGRAPRFAAGGARREPFSANAGLPEPPGSSSLPPAKRLPAPRVRSPLSHPPSGRGAPERRGYGCSATRRCVASAYWEPWTRPCRCRRSRRWPHGLRRRPDASVAASDRTATTRCAGAHAARAAVFPDGARSSLRTGSPTCTRERSIAGLSVAHRLVRLVPSTPGDAGCSMGRVGMQRSSAPDAGVLRCQGTSLLGRPALPTSSAAPQAFCVIRGGTVCLPGLAGCVGDWSRPHPGPHPADVVGRVLLPRGQQRSHRLLSDDGSHPRSAPAAVAADAAALRPGPPSAACRFPMVQEC